MARQKSSASSKAVAYMRTHPEATPEQVALKFNLNKQYVYVLRSKLRKEEKKEDSVQFHPVMLSTTSVPVLDTVNHPPHYKVGGIETIDFIEAKGFNYNLGNAVKYISRAEHKGDYKVDLEKAIWYLKRELGKL